MTKPSILLGTLAHRPLLFRMVRPVVVLGGIVTVAVAGFSTLDGVGVVEGLFWLLDPGSINLYFQQSDGPETLVKAYAVLVFVGLIVAGLWTVETLFSAVFGGQIQKEFKNMKMEQQINALESHVIVCGYGTFGNTIAARLHEKGRDVVVVEHQETQYRQAIDEGVLAVSGDARQEETLIDAGVERADTVIGAIDDANTNIQIAVVARQIAPSVTLIVRAGTRMDETLARQVGADEVIIPEVLCGEQVCDGL